MLTKKTIRTYREQERILLRTDDYIYVKPHPLLREWVSNYTVTFPSPAIISDCYTVIPHGSATMVYSVGDEGVQGNLHGPATKPSVVGAHANKCRMLLIVEFQPAGLYRFIGEKQKVLADHIFPVSSIGFPLSGGIEELLLKSTAIQELITGLDRLFLSWRQFEAPDELRLAAHLIVQNSGTISAKALSESVYYSERHVSRMFDQYLGMNTKTFSRMVRINQAVHILQKKRSSISYVSDVMGFYDLAHFNHEFKSVCGISPSEYRGSMSDYYNEIAKF